MRYLSLALLLVFVLAFVVGCASEEPAAKKCPKCGCVLDADGKCPKCDAEKPAVEKPAAEKPAAVTPAAEKPAAEKPAAE